MADPSDPADPKADRAGPRRPGVPVAVRQARADARPGATPPGAVGRVRFGDALWTTVGLSLLFMVCYAGTNRLASYRRDLPSWVLPVDRRVPFVGLAFVPYLSIDLFFLAAPFLCRDRAELRRLAGRSATAFLVGGACFLVVPLRFAFDRPPAAGPVGAALAVFRRLDGPYNQFPSLHVAMLVVLGVHYARHTRGAVRVGLYGWFALIGVSTVLTYQHHVVDVAGGLALGGLCLFLVPTEAGDGHANRRAGACYAAGAGSLVLLALLCRPWGAVLLWPATATGVMAAECFGTGVVAHRKSGGRVSPLTRAVMAPVRLGQHLSWRHHGRRAAAWDAVAEGVWVGRVLRQREAVAAVAAGVAAVLDLTPDFHAPAAFGAVDYLNLPVPDRTVPTAAELATAAAFIAEHRQAGRTVYVCCKAGDGRSAAAAAAYLVSAGLAASVDDAVAELLARRPGGVVRPAARAAIGAVQQSRRRRDESTPTATVAVASSSDDGSGAATAASA